MPVSEHTTESDPLIGTTIAERYHVEALLGAGGMGAVYRAEHVRMKKRVALKVLHREMTHVEEIVKRFEREAIAAARITHPNVAAATDFGRLDDGSFYLVLEYVEGKSLGDVLEQGPLEIERALAIAMQVAAALEAAHDAGVVHRDLKPDNVMLVEREGQEHVKVLDFGIAKVAASETEGTQLTRMGTVMGTAVYMSPEQAVGDTVDHRTDLYSLGVMLHQMIAGTVPFDADDITQVLAKQITEAPPPLPDGTPAAVSALVQSLLEKRAADRPDSATQVVERIQGLRQAATAPTLLDAPASTVRPVTTAAPRGTSRAAGQTESPLKQPAGRAVIAAGGLALVGLIVAVLFGGNSEEPTTPSATRAPAQPGSAAPAPAARTDGPGTPAKQVAVTPASSASASKRSAEASPKGSSKTKSSSSTTVTHTKSADGRRTTTTTTVKKSTRTTRKTTKRRTGPGGIYIPPPREWFKRR